MIESTATKTRRRLAGIADESREAGKEAGRRIAREWAERHARKADLKRLGEGGRCSAIEFLIHDYGCVYPEDFHQTVLQDLPNSESCDIEASLDGVTEGFLECVRTIWTEIQEQSSPA